MSPLSLKAGMCSALGDVCQGPEADIAQTERPPRGGLSENSIRLFRSRSECCFPFPPPSDQSQRAQAGGEERECGWNWRRAERGVNPDVEGAIKTGWWKRLAEDDRTICRSKAGKSDKATGPDEVGQIKMDSAASGIVEELKGAGITSGKPIAAETAKGERAIENRLNCEGRTNEVGYRGVVGKTHIREAKRRSRIRTYSGRNKYHWRPDIDNGARERPCVFRSERDRGGICDLGFCAARSDHHKSEDNRFNHGNT